MRKYIVKFKGSEKVFGEFASREIASDEVMDYINYFNKEYEGEYISPFDFVLEEVECNGVNAEITCFEAAKRYLNLKWPNEKNIAPLIALDQLFTIAAAWNKADGFVPDFSDWRQTKWFPWFKYNKDAAGFVFAHTNYTPTYAATHLGSRICFMTSERAEQFGKQFADLFNKVFLSKID